MNLIYSLSDSFDKNANNNAFCINDIFYSYQQLSECIVKIRKLIQHKIASTENFIGLAINNDIETYATMFALWMEGKAYIPINPFAPQNRNEKILKANNTTYIFDSSSKTIYSPHFNIFRSFDLENEIYFSLGSILFNEDSIAYVLFTSGSTGAPKGIPISFKNLNALITALDIDEEYKLQASDKCLQMYDLTFDASLTAILPALLSGACLYTIPPNKIKYLSIFQLLEKYKLTVLKMVPSIIYYLRPYFSEINAPTVRYCIFGGEKLYEEVVKEWIKCIPNSKILNHYGPTEFTVCSGYYLYKSNGINKSHNGVLSIGKPFNNVDCLIVDNQNNTLPVGTEGELLLSGNQLTSGYLNNEKLNRDAFILKNNDKGMSKRFYKTGDLCIKDADGDLMYIGRKDFQVKIGGYRVELGEIEFHIRNHPHITSKNLLVLDIKKASGDTELVLVIEGKSFDTNELYYYLRQKLPNYMIPTKTIFMDSFPYNTNGKLDRKKIKSSISI